MSWNAVLNMFCEMKNKAIEKDIDLWEYDAKKETCVDYWARMIGEEKYEKVIEYLQLCEHEDFLLFRYADYASILDGGNEVTMENFWDLYDGFYRECRSVVINIKKDELVFTPFKKFRNLNEAEETSYENVRERIANAKCVEISDKLDGSMQSARFYEGKVQMAGSQSVNKEHSWRLADGYRMMMEQENYQRMLEEHADKTFIFEYISAKDAHVVKYDTEGLFLIGVRDVNNGEEASYREILEYAERYGVLATKLFDKTLEEILEELDDKLSSEAEGFVINIDGFKVKIKYNDYVTMHKMLSAISSVNLIIQNIAEDRFDDLIAKVPNSYRDRVLKVSKVVFEYKNKTEAEIEEAYAQAVKDDKKTFMLWVNDNVRKEIQGYVRCKYLGQSFNVLKRNNSYLKIKDMGVEEHAELFAEE